MNNKIKKYLDYIPLIILLIQAGILISTVASSNIILVQQHYIGLICLGVTVILFFIKHQPGVLFLGLTLLLGLIGVLSFSAAIETIYFGWGRDEDEITLLKFQPVFLLWLTIYFIICRRHLIGVLSKGYWNKLFNIKPKEVKRNGKFPEIVSTHDTLWGQPRLNGRRLAIGDIVNLTDTYSENINLTLSDFQITMEQVRQSLEYCRIQECRNDKPENYCHNCQLRIEMDNSTEEGSGLLNWITADILFKKYFAKDS